MSEPDHKDVVVRARAKYAHKSGRERAFLICNQVAWDLRPDAGLFYKSSGDNYANRSSDVLIFRPDVDEPVPKGQGPTYDILYDAEGVARPQWARTKPTGFGDISKWRAPEDPAHFDPEPPEPVEPPPTDPIDTILMDLDNVIEEMERIRGEVAALPRG